MIVLDVGAGSEPFPLATMVVERWLDDNADRPMLSGQMDPEVRLDFRPGQRPVVVADVEALPFLDKSIDFVWCSHVVEHCDHPGMALDELCRVGKSGMVMVPAAHGEAAMQACVAERATAHKWLCSRTNRTLYFHRCNTADKEETIAKLDSMGLNPVSPLGWYTELRVVWGPESAYGRERIGWAEVEE